MLAQALGLDTANVRVIGPNMGGGYGNKDESRTAALAALLSRPASPSAEYSREEEFVAGRTRHGGRIILRVGVKNNGDIIAIHGDAVLDSGAYQATSSRIGTVYRKFRLKPFGPPEA